jgi:hypothetical protein
MLHLRYKGDPLQVARYVTCTIHFMKMDSHVIFVL